MIRSQRALLMSAALICAIASGAGAQEFREPEGGPLPSYAKVIRLSESQSAAALQAMSTNGRPNVVLTGYWPPTNEMLRQFSTHPDQNPGGWVGENWEGRGYNVYAFFPEFPGGMGMGEGDFEVDYQDTSIDWWNIIPSFRPLALTTFSRAGYDYDWELEGGNRMYALGAWINDYLAPLQPTPELPIANEPPGFERWSTLPIRDIVVAVNVGVPNLYAYQEPIDDSNFLSNYIGYHGNWYHDMHGDPSDPAWNVAAGHIHVGYAMNLSDAVLATEITVRILLTHVDALTIVPGDMNCDDVIDARDIAPFILAVIDPETYYGTYTNCNINRANLNGDAMIDTADVPEFVDLLISG